MKNKQEEKFYNEYLELKKQKEELKIKEKKLIGKFRKYKEKKWLTLATLYIHYL